MKITLTRRLPGTHTKFLIDFYDQVQVLEQHRPSTREEIREALEDAQVLICMLTDRIDAEVLPESVRCVITYSVGLDHLDLDYLKSKKVIVSHTPDVLTDATADLAWALILGAARRTTVARDFVHQGKFQGFGPELFLGSPISGATLGIVGMGRIGLAVAQRAMGFGMKLLYHSRRALPEATASALNAEQVSLETLLIRSDIVSLHCPLKEETRNLIGERELALMKRNAVLINTARGPVVDEVALAAHLKRHPQFWAGLDVYAEEPKIHPALLERTNALCLPHVGSADNATREKMAQICVEEAIRFAKGEEMRYEYPLYV